MSYRRLLESRIVWGILLSALVSCTAGCGLLDQDQNGNGPTIVSVDAFENPRNSLSAFVDVRLDNEMPVTLRVNKGGDTVQTLGPTPARAEHELRILGLLAETSYEFEVVAEDSDGKTATETKSFETGTLPDDIPPLNIKTSKPDKAADGIRLMNMYRWNTPSEGSGYQTGWGMILGVDKRGRVRWYYRADHWTWNAKRLSNGNLVYINADTEIIEIDMMGKVVSRWKANKDLDRKPKNGEFGIHHSVLEQEDGNFVTLSTELQKVDNYKVDGSQANVIGDVAVEFTRSGEVRDTDSMFDVLDDYTTRRQYGTGGAKWNPHYNKDTEDWSHANALAFGDTPNTLIASLRHQNWVVKWDRENDELVWRLGADGDFEFPDGSDGKFPYHQHAAHFTEDDTLLLYDNGNFRRSVDEGERFYTRVVEYELDTSNLDRDAGTKGEVREVWVDERAPKYFAPHVGDVELLPNDTVMVSDGGLLENPEKCIGFDDPRKKYDNKTWNCISNPDNLNWARLVEVTHDSEKETVLEIEIKDRSDDDPRGYTMYRAAHLPSLYPDSN